MGQAQRGSLVCIQTLIDAWNITCCSPKFYGESLQGSLIQSYTTDIPNLIVSSVSNLESQKSNIQNHTTYVLSYVLIHFLILHSFIILHVKNFQVY